MGDAERSSVQDEEAVWFHQQAVPVSVSLGIGHGDDQGCFADDTQDPQVVHLSGRVGHAQ
jgi:hypothetical protein